MLGGKGGSQIMTYGDGAATPGEADAQARRVLHVNLPVARPATRVGHELDGVDRAVSPNQLLVTGSALWGAWIDCQPGVVPDVLIGLGTSGIVPTVAVAIASGLPYLLAWPADRDASDEPSVPEPGFRRAEFLTAEWVRGKRVLVVDDQVVHGHTLASFVSALRDEAADVVGVLCLTEDTSGAGRRRVESTGTALCSARML
jgi:adenine phosphoribosyltransferase